MMLLQGLFLITTLKKKCWWHHTKNSLANAILLGPVWCTPGTCVLAARAEPEISVRKSGRVGEPLILQAIFLEWCYFSAGLLHKYLVVGLQTALPRWLEGSVLCYPLSLESRVFTGYPDQGEPSTTVHHQGKDYLLGLPRDLASKTQEPAGPPKSTSFSVAEGMPIAKRV